MRSVNSGNGLHLFQLVVALATSAVLPGSAAVLGQATGAPADVHAQHAAQSSQANQELARQVAELRTRVAELQEALAAKHQSHPTTQPAMGGNRQMMPGRMAGSPSMGMGMGGMGRMASGMGGMGGMGGGMGMGMGGMSGGAGASGPGMGTTGGTGGMSGMAGGGMTGQGMAGMSGGVEAMKPDEMMGQMMQNMGQMMQMMGQMQGNGMSSMGGMGGTRGGGMKGQGMSGMSGGMGMMDGQMGMMKGMGGMGMMQGMGSGMGMTGGEMGMMKGMMGMGAMSPAGGQVSALPGFPGASHIYHIGATGFFLDHPGHITLTSEQQMKLNQIKESALSEQATLQRQIDQTEQELWQLTASDTPEAGKIEAKAREIAKLQADQRIAFIQAVGKAAGVLTDEQRKQLTGLLPPSSASTGQATPQGGGAEGMGDMRHKS